MTDPNLLVGFAVCIIIAGIMAVVMVLRLAWRVLSGTARYWEIRCWIGYQRRMVAWRRQHGR